jgi:uncharacterized UPF0146 family protein
MLWDAQAIASFIIRNYDGKIVEVGAGFSLDVASLLVRARSERNRSTQRGAGMDHGVVVTDIRERKVGPITVFSDDIFRPKMQLYDCASLIYSIRPPMEIQHAISDVAAAVGADILIRPLSGEIASIKGFSRRLVNWDGAAFYLFKKEP